MKAKKAKVITWSELAVEGDVYRITVRHYDEQLRFVTADWFRLSDGQVGELGYGIPSCDDAISLAESAILERKEFERRAA